ncbi:hypothetical protein AAC387_Pa01g3310 [Persea americana]
MVLPIPKSMTNHLEHMMRIFLWSSEFTRSRRNFIRWQVVCLPTEEGGLGISRLHEQNEASFLKLGRQAASSHSLRARCLVGISQSQPYGALLHLHPGQVSGERLGGLLTSFTRAVDGLLAMATGWMSGMTAGRMIVV